MRALPIAALAVLLAACSDGPSAPNAPAVLSILYGTEPADEQTIRPGDSLQLDADLLDGSGRAVTDQTVEWSSTHPEVARVSGRGLVRGVEAGSAYVVASVGEAADTVRINVAHPPSGIVQCTDADSTVELAAGEVRMVPATSAGGVDAAVLCIDGAAGAEYVLIPFLATAVSGSLSLEVAASGVTQPNAAVVPSRSWSRSVGGGSGDDAPVRDSDFHQRLRERFQSGRGALHRIRSGPLLSRSLSPTAPSASLVAKGDLLRLNVETSSSDGCSEPDYRTGRVMAISEHAVLVADTANPGGGFTTADYEAFGQEFDQRIWPLHTRTFGTPGDVDGNGRSIVFFTRAVNELTSRGSDSYVGGFFYSRDLFPTTGSSGCDGSNHAEMFYMLAPDPGGEINGNRRSTEFVRRKTVGVLAHEFQHLINASRRLYENDATEWEEGWLNEGLSHIAEELVFYEAAGLGAGSNLGGELVGSGAGDAFASYALENVERLVDYLVNPAGSSLMGDAGELSTRGAAWSFLRYAADRHAGAEADLWWKLANARTSGVANLEAALGVSALEWMQDWAASLYLDDSGAEVDARFQQPSWNFRSLVPALAVFGSDPQTGYPLPAPVLDDGGSYTTTLRNASPAFVRLAAGADGQAAVRTLVNGLPAPGTLRLLLARTR